MSAFPAELDASLDFTDASEIDSATIQELDARTRALEAKVGIDDSAVTTSLDYRVTNAGGSSSPTTTAGDMIVRGASVDQRLAIGTNGYVLTVSGGAPAWTAAPWVTATGTILTGRVLAWDGSAWVATALSPSFIGAVPVTRAVYTGTGLSGGGDLTGDLTLSVSFGTGSTSACVGNDARLSDTRTPTDASATLAKLGSDVTVGKIGVVELDACAYAATDSSSDVTVGGFYFDPADYAISEKTTVLSVALWGRVASGGLTGTVTVYDVTSGTPSSVGTASITSTTGALSTISITLPGSAKAYQIAIKVSGGSTAADIILVTGAARRITWS